jgi:hypothetical protein
MTGFVLRLKVCRLYYPLFFVLKFRGINQPPRLASER